MLLLSKLEPSGILDRWPALSCALFIRIFDALIIGSQAIHLDMKDATHAASYTIPKMKSSSVSFSAASSPVNVAASSAVCDNDSGNFISEFGPGLCIIMRLLARFVEVSHSEVSASNASSAAAHAEETFTAGGAELGMAHAMQGYGSWLLYRASQLYCNCNVPQVKEAACSLMLSAISLVRLVSEKDQESIRKMHAVEIDQLVEHKLQPFNLFDVKLYNVKGGEHSISFNELESTLGGGKTVIQDLKESVARCLQTLESHGSAAAPPASPRNP